ncbi:MAG: TolC family protein [Candidatus Hinthialibacter antarcticus]|nr:TolC family protein [Candidatus Hinthialibacter antarcticus]
MYGDYRFYTFLLAALLTLGCSTAGKYRENADKTAFNIIEQKQHEALGRTEPFSVEPPEVTLRRQLLLDQDLQYSGPASLSAKDLDEIEHWPKDDYLSPEDESGEIEIAPISGPLKMTLIEALQIAAKSSRQYQNAKETVFRSALRLDLARDRYRNTFSGAMDSTLSADLSGSETTSGSENSAVAGLSRQFMNGISLTSRIGLDLAKLLNPFDESSSSLFADASISIPLLRGSGKHIVAEPLTQAEREVVYAIYDFERFKREFAVNVAVNYLSVLQAADQITNTEENYRGVVMSTRRTRRLGDAGQIDPVDVDLQIQNEFVARERWIRAEIAFQRSLDSLKILLGLPTDAVIELDRNELDSLAASVEQRIPRPEQLELEEVIPPADAPVNLMPPSKEYVGPYEIEEKRAIGLALENRLDLRILLGEVYDAQRSVVVAADRLRAEFTLLGSANIGEGRSLGSSSRSDNYDLDVEKGRYNALLTLDLPIERTAEVVSYRESILGLEQSVRNLQNLEDSIKLDVRNALRNLQQVRESLRIQEQAEALSARRVAMTDLLLEAGRVEIRDLVSAKEDLLSSQNSLTAARIDYRITELELQRDLGLLLVDETGLWSEIPPEELSDV